MKKILLFSGLISIVWLSISASAQAQTNTAVLPPIITYLLEEEPDVPKIVAFAWADEQTSASYTPNTLYSYNLAGGPITATRSSAGNYRIEFSDLSLNRGNVQVSAYVENMVCNVTGWFLGGANVACRDSSGVPTDSRYTISVIQDSQSVSNVADSEAFVAGYVWANNDSVATYTPTSFYSYNSNGGVNTITRSSVGRYSVSMSGVDASLPSNVLVSAYGSAGHSICNSNGWGSSSFNVECLDASGNAVDSRFTLTVTTAGRAKTGDARIVGYVWANQSASDSYTPATGYSYNSQGDGEVLITRSVEGVYTVSFVGADFSGGNGGNLQVSSYEPTTNCKVSSWGSSNVTIRCYDSSGAPADARYSVAWYDSGA